MNDYDWEKEPDDAERAAEYRKVPKESWDDDDTIDSGDDNDAKTLVSEPSTLTSEAYYIHFVKIKGSKSYETYLVPGYESKDGLAASAIYTYQTSLSSATVLQLYRGIAGAQTEAMAKVRNFSVYMKNDQSGEMEQINKDARFVYAKGIVNVLKFGKYFLYKDVEYVIRSKCWRFDFRCEFRRSDAPKDSPPLVITTNRTARKPARVSVSPLAVSDAGEMKAAEEALIVNGKPTEFMDYLLLADFVYRYMIWTASVPGLGPVFAGGRW